MGGGRGLWKKPMNLEEERRAISEVEKKGRVLVRRGVQF
jgi:hypothetical protein